MKVAILLRVYSRIEDLKYNLQIIRDTWTRNDYYIVVASNGGSDGYVIDEESRSKIDNLVLLDENEGHMGGSNQLLHEGLKHVPDDCDYTLILEADTWLYGDDLIVKYIPLMQQIQSVWASADWYDKYKSVAVDYALINTSFMKQNSHIFSFGDFPECYVANCLKYLGAKNILIKENMPVHVPSYVPSYPYINNFHKRFYVFPRAKMVTHHVEEIEGGMETKKSYFNIVSSTNYFNEKAVKQLGVERFKMKFFINLSRCFLKRSWYKEKEYKTLDY